MGQGSDPPRFPTAVRTASTTTTSVPERIVSNLPDLDLYRV